MGTAIPVLLYSLLFRRLSRDRIRDSAIALGGGIALVALAGGFEEVIQAFVQAMPRQSPLLFAFAVGAIPEEVCKLVAVLVVRNATNRRRPRDLLPIATAIACGFAAGENIVILWWAAAPLEALRARVFVSLPIHVGLAAILAEMLVASGASLSAFGVIYALSAVVLIHGALDAMLFAKQNWAAIVSVVLLVAFTGFVWWRRARMPAQTP